MYELKDGVLELEHGSIKEGLIAVASGKGGVGKSTVTANLAAALKNKGKKVGILDSDVHGFSIPRIVGLEEDARALNEKEIVPPEVNGIKVMSMGSFVEEGNPVIWRAPLLNGALQQFMEDVHWGELDYLLLDLPPGTGDMALNIMQKLPHAQTLVVTTPQITAANVAGRVGKMAEKMDAEVLGVVENMSYYVCSECGHKDYIFGQGGGEKLAEHLETNFLGKLPLITEVREAGDNGELVANSDMIGEEFETIADNVMDLIPEFDPSKEQMFLETE